MADDTDQVVVDPAVHGWGTQWQVIIEDDAFITEILTSPTGWVLCKRGVASAYRAGSSMCHVPRGIKP